MFRDDTAGSPRDPGLSNYLEVGSTTLQHVYTTRDETLATRLRVGRRRGCTSTAAGTYTGKAFPLLMFHVWPKSGASDAARADGSSGCL